MADGSWQSIEKIRLGEEVVTAEGETGRVAQLHVHPYEGDLIRLRLHGHKHLKMTPDHKVLTKRGYVPAKDLTKDDWVAIPRHNPVRTEILQTARHVQGETAQTKTWHPERSYGRASRSLPSTEGVPWANYKRIPDFIHLTPAAGRIFGLYLAEGHTEKYSVHWSFGTHEADTLVAELVGLLRDEWGLEARTQLCNENGTVTQVVVCGKLWVRLFRSLCGVGAAGKRVHGDLLGGPDDFLTALYLGWADGDGNEANSGYRKAASVSHDLILNMYDIANRLGWRPTVGWEAPKDRPHQKIRSKRTSWHTWLCSKSDNWMVKLEEKTTWRRVRRLEYLPFKGDVYDIGVEGHHSFVAEGIGVHNCWQLQMDLTGMALTWMVPNKLEAPYELYPIPTSLAIPQPAINPDYPDGYYRIQPVYPYGPFSSYPTPATAVGAPIPAQWMIRMKYQHPVLRYDGWSPLTALRLQIDEVEAMDRSRWYSMNRVINPSAVLNFDDMDGAEPLPEAEIERIRAEFEADHQGPENFGRLFVASPGSRLEKWSVPLKDMEFIDGWNQLVGFILGAGFGITKPAAGMVEDSSYSTLFATLKQLHLVALDPFCHRVAHYLTNRLGPFFGDDLLVEVRTARIDDHDIKNAKLSLLQGALALTKNEMRRANDYPVVAEAWGEEIAGQPSPPPPQPMAPGQGAPGAEGGAAPAPAAPAVPEAAPAKDLPSPQVPKKKPSDAIPEAPNPLKLDAVDKEEGHHLSPPQIETTRPRPGSLGRQTVKPPKGVPTTKFKELSRYEMISKALENGNGHS